MKSSAQRPAVRRTAALVLVAGLSLSAAACSSGKSGGKSAAAPAGGDGPVTITVPCEPPTSQAGQRKEWLADVATFEKANPTITINGIDTYPCEDTATFTAQMRAGTEPDVFHTYFTDLNQVLDAGQAADITSYVNDTTVPGFSDIAPSALAAVTAGKTLYGLPTGIYTQGLIINRKLFKQAGLDPDHPPTTWADVEKDAKTITALGNGIYGYGEYSAGNNGGWHFSSEVDANGGQMINADGTKAAFNAQPATEVLRALHQMRFVDGSMSPTQQLKWGDLQKQMAAGKLGMYVASPDDIYNVIVPQDGGNVDDYGMGPIPSTSGTPAGSLSGGDDVMFNKHDTPAQIRAGIKWIAFSMLTPGQGQFNYARTKADGLPVGFPEPLDWVGATSAKNEQLKAASATVNTAYFKTFVDAHEKGMGEPVDAQAVYKTLDATMLSVLNDPNADVPGLLKTAEGQVDTLLANAG